MNSKIRLEDYGDLLNELNNYQEFQFGCYTGDTDGVCPFTAEQAFEIFSRVDDTSRWWYTPYWLGRMVAAGYFKE